MSGASIEEFKDYIDRVLENWSSDSSRDVHSFARDIAELIREFHKRRKYLGIVVEGYQGTGKTTLLLYIAKNYYGSWEMAFKSIRFDLREFLEESLSLLEDPVDRRVAIRVLDDFAFQGGSKWRRSTELIDLLEYMNIIRTMYTCLLVSYVDDSAARFFRNNAKIKLITQMVDLDTVEVRVYARKYSVMGVLWKRVESFRFRPSEFFGDPEYRELYEEYWSRRRRAGAEKGRILLEGLDRKKQLIFSTIFGYYIGKYNYPIRDLFGFMRSVLELEFRNEVAIGINRLVKKKLEEYEIYPRDTENGKQETRDVKRKVRRRSRKQGSNVK